MLKNGNVRVITMQKNLQFRIINNVKTNGIGDAIVIAMRQYL
jgi:hypothetical protein